MSRKNIKRYFHKLIMPLSVAMSIFIGIPAFSQTAISGSINISQTIPKVERSFTGFNSGEGNMETIFNFNGTSTGMEVNPNFYATYSKVANKIYWRFPGGTTSNF